MIRLALSATALLLLTVPISEATVSRSYHTKVVFARLHPCPSTGFRKPHCPGYIIDHIKPLCAGGPDAAKNMQWQTVAEAKKKDKIELHQCALLRAKK